MTKWKDRLPGGLADARTPADFRKDPKLAKELQKGIRVELEHTSNKKLATEIAMDHLMESPTYYTDLAKVHHENPRHGPVRRGRIPTAWVSPPVAAQRIAKKALKERGTLRPARRGGLGKGSALALGITSGVERAKSIARGDLQPAEDIRDFFNRFKGTYQDAVLQGKAWEDSKVQQAWDLWGGSPMWKTAQRALEKTTPKTKKKRDIVREALK